LGQAEFGAEKRAVRDERIQQSLSFAFIPDSHGLKFFRSVGTFFRFITLRLIERQVRTLP
jgi:hypothetical protein